jgi:Skp family chaperone for outer membrane proteins
LKSLEKRAADSQPENSKPDSLSDILRGEYENEKLEQNEAINENKEVFEEWINANSNKNEDNTIVLMVVGIVIAVIIGIGIAIKIKKN